MISSRPSADRDCQTVPWLNCRPVLAGAVKMTDPVDDVVLVRFGQSGIGGQAEAVGGEPAGVERGPVRVEVQGLPAHGLEEQPGFDAVTAQELAQFRAALGPYVIHPQYVPRRHGSEGI